jgi:hypothetical protein
MLLLNKSLGMIAIIAVMMVSLSVSAQGTSIYSTGFEGTETPPFTVGNINGQNGWTVFNSSTFDQVENSFFFAGAQAADVVPTGDAAGQSGMYHVDTATGSPLIDLNAELYIASSGTESTDWQFAALGNFALSQFIGGINLAPAAGSTDTINAIAAGDPVVGSFTLNTWHNVDLLMNFAAQTYTISLDGTVLASNLAFCGDGGACLGENVPEGTFTSFFDVFASVGENDIGFMDNVSLSSVATPEPATFGLAGVALLADAFLRRRR